MSPTHFYPILFSVETPLPLGPLASSHTPKTVCLPRVTLHSVSCTKGRESFRHWQLRRPLSCPRSLVCMEVTPLIHAQLLTLLQTKSGLIYLVVVGLILSPPQPVYRSNQVRVYPLAESLVASVSGSDVHHHICCRLNASAFQGREGGKNSKTGVGTNTSFDCDTIADRNANARRYEVGASCSL